MVEVRGQLLQWGIELCFCVACLKSPYRNLSGGEEYRYIANAIKGALCSIDILIYMAPPITI